MNIIYKHRLIIFIISKNFNKIFTIYRFNTVQITTSGKETDSKINFTININRDTYIKSALLSFKKRKFLSPIDFYRITTELINGRGEKKKKEKKKNVLPRRVGSIRTK